MSKIFQRIMNFALNTQVAIRGMKPYPIWWDPFSVPKRRKMQIAIKFREWFEYSPQKMSCRFPNLWNWRRLKEP